MSRNLSLPQSPKTVQLVLTGNKGKVVKVVAARRVMQEDWLYTVFDQQWIPSDGVENALAAMEGSVAPIFEAVQALDYLLSDEEREQLCEFLGLTSFPTSEHPEIGDPESCGIRRRARSGS